ncbi:MAG: DUF2442 domain-containing protein [Spirochaetaceae bacterium]
MNIPKIINVYPKEHLILSIIFSDGVTREYDCSKIINRNDHYEKLKDDNFFKNVHIDVGGHGISWDDYVDISEYEILENSINR